MRSPHRVSASTLLILAVLVLTACASTNSPAVGPTGQPGKTGLVGATGAIGATGATGPSGFAGAAGMTGNAGESITGPAGAVGASGSAGAVGMTGNTGAAGSAGGQGVAGPRGAQGPQGEMGAPGATGPAGSGLPIAFSSVSSSWITVQSADSDWGSFTPVASLMVPQGVYAVMVNGNSQGSDMLCELIGGTTGVGQLIAQAPTSSSGLGSLSLSGILDFTSGGGTIQVLCYGLQRPITPMVNQVSIVAISVS